MTHPMLEKVARALYDELYEGSPAFGWDADKAFIGERYLQAARAAVQALLEPDEGMIMQAVHDPMWDDFYDWPNDQVSRHLFRVMLIPLIEGEGE